MTKAFYISLASLLILATIDFLSYKNQKPSDSITQLKQFVEDRYSDTKETVLGTEFLDLIQKDSLSNSELARIKHVESEFFSNSIAVKLSKNGSQIFWTESPSSNSDCQSFKKGEYQLEICQELFTADNELKQSIYSRAKVHHRILLTQDLDDSSLSWNGAKLIASDVYRSYRINNVLILAYLIIFLLLIWQCFKINSWISYGILALVRIPLLLFDQWHQRFENSSLHIELFDWQRYGSLDLVVDSIIIFFILLKISSFLSSDTKLRDSKGFLACAGILLSLLIISHIRLIQHITLCDSFNITINDISSINIPEASIFLSLILLVTALFIFSSIYIRILKTLLHKNQFYISLIGLVLITTAISLLFQLDVHPAYLSMFLLCFFILIDLFVDLKQKSITWIIWWAIFFGLYMSSCFFNYDIQKQTKLRHDYLHALFNDIDETRIDEIINSNILDSISSGLAQLMTLPEEASYNRSDLLKYLTDKYKIKHIKIDLQKNKRQLFAQWPGVRHCEKIEDVYLDHLSNTLWKQDQISDSLVIYTGIQIKKPAKNKYPLLVYNGDHEMYNSFSVEKKEIVQLLKMEGDELKSNSKIFLKYVYNGRFAAYSVTRFESLVKPIALFSYLFTCIILIFLLISFLSRYSDQLKLNWPLILSQFQSLNSRIQSALILVILLSFIFIAAVTSSFIISFINSKNNQFITEKLETLSNDLSNKLSSADTSDEAMIIAANYTDELEEIHNTDIRIFDFNEMEPDSKFFPFAYFKKANNIKSYSEKEQNSGFRTYFPIRHLNKTLGYLELKISSDSVQGFNIYDFLGSIFNVYVFLFLVASVFAILIAKSITKPLALLNQKLSALRLGKRNELVDWERDDEMGTLINNYNKMVQQLESSVELLAKTERDSAWREMAKQVAHEIKNPLTPMKMYIQHLEKAIKQQPERATEISKKISATLLEQVENLTQIADSFSNFAELPQSSNEKLELNKVVELVHNLFRKRDDMDIRLSEPIDPVHVYADKNQLIRILNNLVKNAIESIPKDRKGIIHLELYTKDDKAIIKVEDNGSGIDPAMAQKIFQPKFTTKDSGSGLGLAIAMNMIESMNGRLYFKSEVDKGTTFFIELDVIRKSFDQEERISLD